MTATLKPRTTVITLLQGDDIDPAQDLASKVETAAREDLLRRLGDDEATGTAKATEAFNAFMEEAEQRGIPVPLAALNRKAYRKLLGDHPPRVVPSEDNSTALHDEDAAYGFNFQTLGDDLLPATLAAGRLVKDEDDAARAVLNQRVADGTYAPDPADVEFIDNLSDGQFSELYSAAVTLNQGRSQNPKVRLSSPVDRTSDETSNSLERLG